MTGDIYMYRKLKDMKLPDDIRHLNNDQMEITAIELRDFLLSNVSKTGGHLASNLGVVELTLVLHKYFDTKKDRIIWDVGHQSYIHKILTGRMDSFHTLRQLDGLSGFPKTKESIHDAFDTGHSSNSLSVAYGMAAARDINGGNENIVAVIGDGSLTGGEAYEGLNNLGGSKSKVIVILNDNGMSIRQNTGGISNHLSKLRVSRGYSTFKSGLKQVVRKVPAIGNGLYMGASKMRDIVKYALVDGVFFEELGFTYLGPIDGHDIAALSQAVNAAKNSEKSCVIHIMTQKGKGYKNAEQNPHVFHGTGPFDKTTGMPEKKHSHITYSEVFGKKITEMAEQDERITAISAAMIDGVGLEEFAGRFPERIFDAGIAEQHAVSFAAGLAARGMKPVVAIYSTFLQRAYDQILIDVCMPHLPVIFAIDRAGVVGADGETHNGIFDLSYLTHMPGMTVLAPSNGKELESMLEYAARLNGPCAIRYPKGDADMPESDPRPLTEGTVKLKDGDDTCIWAAGSMVSHALGAAWILEKYGIRCAVYDARWIKPLDKDTLAECADKYNYIFTAEDNVADGGFGSLICDALIQKSSGTKVIKAAWPEKFIEHGQTPELFERYGLNAAGLAERIRNTIEGKA